MRASHTTSLIRSTFIGPALLLSIASCGGRSVNLGDAGPNPGTDSTMGTDSRLGRDAQQTDGQFRLDSLPTDLSQVKDRSTITPDWTGIPDLCVLPPGSCTSQQDCPPDQKCVGCEPDPCCPWCSHCLGTCTTVQDCQTNADCSADQFCKTNGNCGVYWELPGQCTPRPDPVTCPEYGYCPEVCGCDGKIYCDECHANGEGVSVNANMQDCLALLCSDLQSQYQVALESAKQCCPTCKIMNQCMQVIENDLVCPCPTYVNAITPELTTLQTDWKNYNCAKYAGVCPPMPCLVPNTGECTGTSTVGSCQDIY